MRKIILWVTLLFILPVNPLFSNMPFHRGVNLTNWFQGTSPRQIQFTKFTKQDFINIKSLGCDVIRLPINLNAMTNGAPDYVLDPLFVSFLDSAVTWAEELKINLILDNHTFDPGISTDPSIETSLIKVWTQMAQHYKDRSNYVYYEVLNEPHGIADAQWDTIQQHVINAIRTVDKKHTIVVGAANWNSYNDLQNLPEYADTNLIYTFHFYAPMLFTHQGANWTGPSMEKLRGVPFPYNADSMPALPDTLKGTWVESAYNSYDQDGTFAKIKQLIDIAVNFKNSRHVKLYCGEMGVYDLYSSAADRRLWYDSVRTYLETNGIPWTMWDYTGSFGIFKKNSNDLFNSDVDTALVRALGMTVPEQHTFSIKPDTTGFPVYYNYIEKGINESDYAGSGTIDFYSQNHPNNGKYCIYWTGGEQYTSIGFDFAPNKDMSVLKQNGYALDFMVRGTTPGTIFDVRFIDTKTADTNDHPWRMRYTINENMIPWDGRWHHVHIPLSDFTEQGSWDNGWYDPEGLFDWTAVDRFEIAAEDESMKNVFLWFDNIQITDMDTARVLDTSRVTIDTSSVINNIKENHSDRLRLNIMPNPASSFTVIDYHLWQQNRIAITIYNLMGQKLITLVNQEQNPGAHSVVWRCTDNMGTRVEKGIYICEIRSPNEIHSEKLVVQ